MELTFLVDNHTTIDQYYLAEPALSVLVRDQEAQVLLDTGYSDAFLRNAVALGIDLTQLDWLVFSHGHFDHTWGLADLIRHYTGETIRGKAFDWPRVLAHPDAFEHKLAPDLGAIGSMMDAASVGRFFEVSATREPRWITDRILFLGEIEEQLPFERTEAKNRRQVAGGWEPDELLDDTSLALLTDQGLVLLTGCAHRGVCSTLARAMALTGERRVCDVIGGFHLLGASQKRLDQTAAFLSDCGLTRISPCHCVDLAAKASLGRSFQLREVGSATKVSY